MSNIQKMITSKNKSKQLFASTVSNFRNLQGFYSRLYRDINEMNKENFLDLCKAIVKQKFQSSLDVIYWLEC